MCLILFAYQIHPKYSMIIGANRDELFNRPTALASYWDDHPQILAGRDLSKMGTWIGVTKTGRFAALTNYRNPHEDVSNKKSRGDLVARFLQHHQSPQQYMLEVQSNRHAYPGFNLLVGNADELYYYSNVENKIRALEPGIYGLSNHLLDTDWPKVTRGKKGLTNILDQDNVLVEQLFTLLKDDTISTDDVLPRTGISLEG